ncbi:MAG: alpha/beta hydrolase family protein [Promethearchaeota archaeon]
MVIVITKNLKRSILIYFDLIFSMLIWNVNQNIFGNPFLPCFILSMTTFLIIYTPFEIYWSFADLWYDRWISLTLKDCVIKYERIEVDRVKNKKKEIAALLVSSKDKELVENKNSIIIIAHGFSDTKESLQNYFLPFSQLGYVILSYDARGTGKSKKVGRRSHFLKRIEDFEKILKWVSRNEDLNKKRICCVGFSIGALSVLCGGFSNEAIDKIIAISAISNYRKNLPRFNVIVMLSYFLKGVKLFPKREENLKLSPSIMINQIKKNLPEEKWRNLCNRVLLIHSRNDKIIKMINFEENAEILDLTEENRLIINKGGHTHKKNELILVGRSLKFLESNSN